MSHEKLAWLKLRGCSLVHSKLEENGVSIARQLDTVDNAFGAVLALVV